MARMSPFQGEGCGFESHRSLHFFSTSSNMKLLKKTDLKKNSLVYKILDGRGYSDVEKVEFLNSYQSDLCSENHIHEIVKAAEHIKNWIENGKKIVIHGDYDVDGISASAILWDFLFYQCKSDSIPIIPDRVDEGYSLSEKSIKRALDLDAKAIITVDCGIRDYELVNKYRDKVDFIITDHHQFVEHGGQTICPPAKAVVHSMHPKGEYPEMISGAATAWMLIRAINNLYENKFDVDRYLDLVALSTVCDIIPLKGESRKLVIRGIKKIRNTKSKGLNALIDVCGIKKSELNSYHMGFVLGPRINAASRVTNNSIDSLRLLATRNSKQAVKSSVHLNELNQQRQDITKKFYQLAVGQVDESKRYILVKGEAWPEGILGLVAGKLSEEYKKPTFVASINNKGGVKGSCRSSLKKVRVDKALESSKKFLTKFGGHLFAGGFSSNLNKFKGIEDALNDHFTKKYSENDFIDEMYFDIVLQDFNILNFEEIKSLEVLEPYGFGNPSPVFLFENIKIVYADPLRNKPEHVRFVLSDKNSSKMNGIGFSIGDKVKDLSLDESYNIYAEPYINMWNNKREIELKIKEIK